MNWGEGAFANGETGLLAILATLVRDNVEFVLIGGLAVAHHGYPRATKDVDVVPAPDPTNIANLWSALVELGAEPLAVGDFGPREVPFPLSLETLLEGAIGILPPRTDVSMSSSTAKEPSRRVTTTRSSRAAIRLGLAPAHWYILQRNRLKRHRGLRALSSKRWDVHMYAPEKMTLL